jgi:2-keto-4-pentenoate hydratase/2-oxohepta-3-ene-1,7-dioic acid hydratase in catechol pathway
MELATVRSGGRIAYGVVQGDSLANLSAVLDAPTLRAALGSPGLGAFEELARHAPQLALAEVDWLPVVPDPAQIFCVGLNYEEHRAETGRPTVEHPTIFLRMASTLVGHDQPVLRAAISDSYDYEGELAVVIGTGGRRIRPENAMGHVAGYVPFNDVSVRDWQYHTSQFTPGKNFPTTGCIGPRLVTADQVGDLRELTLETRLNGERVQHARLGEMIFFVDEVISYLSQFCELQPGDVIATGTPAGIGARRDPPLFMRAGDVVEVEIAKVGLLRNPIVDEW